VRLQKQEISSKDSSNHASIWLSL